MCQRPGACFTPVCMQSLAIFKTRNGESKNRGTGTGTGNL